MAGRMATLRPFTRLVAMLRLARTRILSGCTERVASRALPCLRGRTRPGCAGVITRRWMASRSPAERAPVSTHLFMVVGGGAIAAVFGVKLLSSNLKLREESALSEAIGEHWRLSGRVTGKMPWVNKGVAEFRFRVDTPDGGAASVVAHAAQDLTSVQGRAPREDEAWVVFKLSVTQPGTRAEPEGRTILHRDDPQPEGLASALATLTSSSSAKRDAPEVDAPAAAVRVAENRTALTVIALCALGGISAAYFSRRWVNSRVDVAEGELMRQVDSALAACPRALRLLGSSPAVDLEARRGAVGRAKARFSAPVTGAFQSGTLRVRAERGDDDVWRFDLLAVDVTRPVESIAPRPGRGPKQQSGGGPSSVETVYVQLPGGGVADNEAEGAE